MTNKYLFSLWTLAFVPAFAYDFQRKVAFPNPPSGCMIVGRRDIINLACPNPSPPHPSVHFQNLPALCFHPGTLARGPQWRLGGTAPAMGGKRKRMTHLASTYSHCTPLTMGICTGLKIIRLAVQAPSLAHNHFYRVSQLGFVTPLLPSGLPSRPTSQQIFGAPLLMI